MNRIQIILTVLGVVCVVFTAWLSLHVSTPLALGLGYVANAMTGLFDAHLHAQRGYTVPVEGILLQCAVPWLHALVHVPIYALACVLWITWRLTGWPDFMGGSDVE